MKYKRQALNAINNMMLDGHTVHSASKALNLPHWQVAEWIVGSYRNISEQTA
jgi:hypothetical protein